MPGPDIHREIRESKNMDKRKVLSADLQHLRFKQYVSKQMSEQETNSSTNIHTIESNFYLGLIILFFSSISDYSSHLIHGLCEQCLIPSIQAIRFQKSQGLLVPRFIPFHNYNYFLSGGPPKSALQLLFFLPLIILQRFALYLPD